MYNICIGLEGHIHTDLVFGGRSRCHGQKLFCLICGINGSDSHISHMLLAQDAILKGPAITALALYGTRQQSLSRAPITGDSGSKTTFKPYSRHILYSSEHGGQSRLTTVDPRPSHHSPTMSLFTHRSTRGIQSCFHTPLPSSTGPVPSTRRHWQR